MNTAITTKIKPKDIKIDRQNFMASMWQNSETETSACLLCKFAKIKGSWNDFTREELEKTLKIDEEFWFNHLTRYNISGKEYSAIIENIKLEIEDCEPFFEYGKRYTQRVNDDNVGSYSFTNEFIEEVYRLSPNNKK